MSLWTIGLRRDVEPIVLVCRGRRGKIVPRVDLVTLRFWPLRKRRKARGLGGITGLASEL